MKQTKYEIKKNGLVDIYVEDKLYITISIDDAVQFYIEDLRSWTEDFEKEV